MSYKSKDIGAIGVDDESNYPNKTSIKISVDNLNKATIRFGSDYSIRLNEDDVDALRQLLFDATKQLMIQNDSYYKYGTSEREVEEAEENGYELCLNCQGTYHVDDIHLCNN
jgi:hypothetical protein